ncbi:hypothetical protein [Mesorhizobium sp. M1E.F.Ca.ET.041.01.1.1]|uniref:hypothetical protein n=1 Tax=Mesorhizobium sp. M1E.F.Ca.ET.041.01.1.1 TaxID=2496759 RepID=UPI000FCC12CC|nr:hypothetical protein [Mesorhizobium sp. M1E.F.Ca.ET.041.01.1.1]RUW33793.1 hypothetical protein EOA38_12130 [Mesorhizobium sp. M1E.F.Ca.ET.041.01.1.1]RWD92367.1 MAG: hypothetical protein EOS38_00610 [Mesorhizobium sp.]
MTAERLRVREAGGEGYEVLDYDGRPIAICVTIVHAAQYVRGLAARFWLDWTVDPATSVFSASFLGSNSVGRIQRAKLRGLREGSWLWSISTNDSRWRNDEGPRGREHDKDLAMVQLEHQFTCHLANTPHGPSPYARAKGLE